jgi:hypothetical protein
VILRSFTRLIAWAGRRSASRSRWLAERLWFLAAIEVAWLANRHWRRLEPTERRRLRELIRKSRGRPSKLTSRERAEAQELLQRLDYAELGGSVASTLLPFRPVGRLVEFALGRAQARSRAARSSTLSSVR